VALSRKPGWVLESRSPTLLSMHTRGSHGSLLLPVVRLTGESHISVVHRAQTEFGEHGLSALAVGLAVHKPPASTPILPCVLTPFSWNVLTESGYITKCLDGLPSGYILHGATATLTLPARPFMLEFRRKRDPARLYLPQFPYRSLAFQTRFVTGLVGCLGVCLRARGRYWYADSCSGTGTPQARVQ